MPPLSGRADDNSGGNSPAPLMNVSQVSFPLHSQYLRSETSSEKVSDKSPQHLRGSSSGSTLPVAFPPIMPRYLSPELPSPRSGGINTAGQGVPLKEGVSFPVTPVKTPLHSRSPPPSPARQTGKKMMGMSFKERQRVSEQLHRFSSKERSAGPAPQNPVVPRAVAGRCGRVPKGTISFAGVNSEEGTSSNAHMIGKGRCKPMKGEEGDEKVGTVDTRDPTPSLPQFSPVFSPVTCKRQTNDDNDSILKDTFAVTLRQPSTVLSFKDRQRRSNALSPCFRRSPTLWTRTTAPNDSGSGLLRQACSFTTAPFSRKLDGAKLERQPRRFLEGGKEDNPVEKLSDDAGPSFFLLGSWGTPRGEDSSALVRQSTFPVSNTKFHYPFAESPESRSSLECTVTPRHIKTVPISGKLSETQHSQDNSRCAPGLVTPPVVSPRLIGRRVPSPSGGSSLKARNDTAESLSTSVKVNIVKQRGSKQHGPICRGTCTTSNILSSSEVVEDPAEPDSPPPKSDGTVKQRQNISAEPEKEGLTPLKNSVSQGNPQTTGGVGITGGADRREREKILKRPASYFSSQTLPLQSEDSTMANKTIVENLLPTLQNVDESSSHLESGSSTGRVEVSVGRFPTVEGTSVFAATRENGRKSSFSSLYFSMMKHHRSQRLMPNVNQPGQMMPDEETNREVRGDSGFDELLNGDDDSFTGSLRTIGILETEEHVFLSRYELLPEGQTQMEIMLDSIRTIGGQSCNKSNSCRGNLLGRGSFMNASARHDGFGEEEGDSDDVFTFGSISPQYATDPVDEDPLVDCKVAARLLFDAEKGVMLISADEEVGKYISQAACMGANNGVSDEEQSMCKCSQEFIAKDVRGVDYSRYHAHDLYHHCVYCNRRPAAFLCLHCLRSTCPSHVTRHYKECEAKCTLFLNLLDIMTSFDRIFWCEKCRCFTWKYTEVYDPLVDQLAVTRGTHLKEAVRDISCVGYEVQLKKPNHRHYQLSLHASPALEAVSPSANASPNFSATPAPSAAASSMPFPMDSRHERLMSGANHSFAPEQRKVTIDTTATSAAAAAVGSPIARLPQRDSGKPLPDSELLRMGEAVQKLVSLGAKVQGWRATQEDAEAAFVIAIPALSPQLLSDPDATPPPPKTMDSPEDAASETIAMALFCVFDGHGGDAVAKLAASNFESHLRKAVASARHDDVQARSLLFQLDFESSTALFSVGEASPIAARENAFNRQLSRPDDEKDNEVSNDDVVPEVAFTTETLRRYVESTNACRASPPHAASLPNFVPATADKPIGTQALFSMVDIGGLGDITTDAFSTRSNLRLYNAASPVVSQQEMEMLRAYFASIMEDALLSLDDDLRHSPEGTRGDYQCTGCTACIVGITANFILCANLGDSGAAVYTPFSIRQISVTHRITDPAEEARIKAAGYSITGNRIEGMLAVTRALGDYDFKQCGGKGPKEQAVIAVPDVTIMPVPLLQDNARWGVVAACDGVWDSATLHQVHHAIINTPNDLDVAGSVMDALLQAREMALALPQKASALLDGVDAAETVSLDAQLLTSAAGIFAQCVAPNDNDEGIGMDNCSLFLIERR
ncbi:hypothetical protein MOQ_006450 [Trypanosoma cruzi marinkellei]|uniref:protein-serine/threonine phosphatase n=1 Tax=Trypanosoma cruzi marinkellei TaxID=85056 RepID=K2MRR2_TRYCR|nr:hypothetical protein MOQ_006450 [Trypanosoma cruzi marinkellei]